VLFLPTYTATAWYHKKLDPDLQLNLWKTLNEVRDFATNEYSVALMKGDQLSTEDRNRVVASLVRYTGLSREYIEETNLRIDIGRFTKELTRDAGHSVGRLDSRMKAWEYDSAGERYEFDPSYDATIYGPYSGAFNDYVRRDLKFESDLPYEILTGRVRPWNYNNVQNQFLNVAETLRGAMHENPHLKVWIANGYYDLATPFFATEYTINQMNLHPSLRKNITMTYYESGHMMYIHMPSLVQFKKDFVTFIRP
jgi:carboxypeptidase C (cathepsin A)